MAGFFKIPGENSDGASAGATSAGSEPTGSQQGAPAERSDSTIVSSLPLFHIPGSAPAASTGDSDARASSNAHMDLTGVDAGSPRVDGAGSKTEAGSGAEPRVTAVPRVGETVPERPASPFAGAFRLHAGNDAGSHGAGGAAIADSESGEPGTTAPRPANPFNVPAVDRVASSQRAGVDAEPTDRGAGSRGAVSVPSGSVSGPASGQPRVSAVSAFRAPVDGSVNGGSGVVPSALGVGAAIVERGGGSTASAESTVNAAMDGVARGASTGGEPAAALTPSPRPTRASNGEGSASGNVPGGAASITRAGHAIVGDGASSPSASNGVGSGSPSSDGPSSANGSGAGSLSASIASSSSAASSGAGGSGSSWSPDSFLDVGAGFDPGWSGTVGAGEDAPAFTGGGFLDLGDEDDDEPYGGGDDGGDDEYSVGDYVPSGDGETAGFVSDDGTVVHGDLDLPQSWKATTTHDPGDDGQQSVAWNKDGKAAAVKPSEERLTVVKRYHKATKEEMRVRREVAEQVALQGGLPDEGGALIDPKTAKPVRGSSAATGGSGDSEIDEKALRFGVKVGTGKAKLEKRLRNKHDVDAAIARRVQVLEWKKGFHVTFGAKEVRGLDYLTRWSYATTAQIARVVGWRDRKERRLVRALEKWEEMGWVRQDVVFSGPRLWYPRRDGAELSEHAWLGGVSPARVNPMSQSHSLGLSSIASWLLCGWEDAPDILQLGEQEWRQLQADVKAGEALVISEKEYRAPWTRIRQTHKGLLPAEYRHAFIGDIAHGGEGRYQQWARDYQAGKAKLEDSPDWVACDPSLQGDDMWIWTLWSNYVWNPKLALDAARMDGVDVDGVDRAAQLAAIRDYRGSGYVPVEDRLDLASNKPLVNKEIGDAFALLDHLPDLIIARKRDPKTGAARSIAIELELTAKQPADYARSMAGFGSVLGQTLFSQVVWVVPSKAVARAIELGARSVGLEEGVDYRIVPFASAEKRNSFWSGADIVPAVFDKYHRVQPLIDPGTFLLS